MPKISGEEKYLRQIDQLKSEIRELKEKRESFCTDQDRYQAIFEGMQEIYFEVDLAGNLTHFNPAVCHTLGYDDPAELMGKNNREYATPDTARRMYQIFNEIHRTGKPAQIYDYEIFDKNGEPRFLELSAYLIHDATGNPIGYRGVGRDITERKKTEEKLRQSEDRFRTIFESMQEIYFEVDLNGDLTYFNPALCKITGTTPKDLMGKNNREYTPPKTAKRMYRIFNKLYKTGKPADISDYEIVNLDGEIQYLELSAYLIRDANGQITGFRGLGRDITHRKKTEKALRESEERFRRLNEASFGGICMHDAGILIDCNAELSRMTGYSNDELIGMDGLLLCAPEWRKTVRQKIEADVEDPYDIIALKKDGSRFPVEIQSKSIPFQGKTVRVAEFRDITTRKKTEESIRRSRVRYRELYKEALKAEEIYQSLLNSSADAIALLEINQAVQFVNPGFTRIFGWTIEELKGSQIPFVPKPSRKSFNDLVKKLLDTGEPVHGVEGQRFTRDGLLLDVSMSVSHYVDHAGNPTGILMILRDITESKRYQWHMHQAQKMESLGTLAGGIAHDFNNLLMGIQGRLSLLRLQVDAAHPGYGHIKDIEHYVIRSADLTQQLLGIARTGKYEVKPADINELIRNQCDLFGRTRKEIQISQDFASSLQTAEVDQRQIEQVILNMFVNASHAMPKGGNLYVKTINETLSRHQTEPYAVGPGQYIKISITDTGTGMDEATRKRVFEPFFTTKKRERGTGLGLASAYGIIKNHGGYITVYSEIGRGTTFNIYLPASAKTAIREVSMEEKIITGKGTILLVDDEEMIISVGEEMIRMLGYEVMTAKGGKAALEVYREHINRIDLVILDLIMPGMSGSETFDQLRSMDPETRVLLASGYSINGEASSVMKRGCNGFIQKPFNIQELSQRIHKILRSDLN